MKKYLDPYLTLVVLIFLCSACHTDSSTTTDVAAPGNISLSSYEVYPYNATGVWGVFYAIKSTGANYDSRKYTIECAEACILNSNGIGYTPLSGITINNAAGLTCNNNNVFRYNIDTGTNFYHYSDSIGLSSGANWAIYYNTSGPGITYTDNSPMPYFNYPIVASAITISSSQPLTINLNSSFFTNADSVYVILPYYTDIPGKVYPVNAGVITVTSADLRGTLSFNYNSNLIIMPFSSKTVKISGKNYLFVKAFKYVQPMYITN